MERPEGSHVLETRGGEEGLWCGALGARERSRLQAELAKDQLQEARQADEVGPGRAAQVEDAGAELLG